MAERERERVPGDGPAPIGDPVATTSDDVPTDRERIEAAPPAAGRRQLPVLLAAAVLAFGIDLVTKLLAVAHLSDRGPVTVVPKVLDLELTRNPGAAFGVASGATIIFTVVAAAVVVFIVSTARRLRSRGWAIALGLLLGGALGNLGDRLFRDPGPLRGHVVDWIHLTHWPIFNVADSCIVIGGLLAVLLSLRGHRLDGTVDQHER
jgi:signal peptidase II